APPGTEPSNLVGRKNNSEFQVELFVIADSGIDLGFDRAEIVRMHPRTKGLVRSCMVQAEDIFEFPRPRSSPALYIPVPEANVPAAHRQTQAFFALAKRFLQTIAFGDVVDNADEVRRNAAGIVQRRHRNLTMPPARGVHRLFLPSHGLTGQDRLPIMVQHHVTRWWGYDVTHERSEDLFSSQSGCNEEVAAHRQKSEFALRFDRDVKQDPGNVLVDCR